MSALLRARRTIHRFDPNRAVPSELLASALDAAVCAPNHKSTEPWRFYVLGSETRRHLIDLNAQIVAERQGSEAGVVKRRRWQEIPAYVVVTCRRSADALRAQEDYAAVACAVQNLMLSLWSDGVGSKWTTGPVTRDARLHAMLGLPEDEYVVALLHIGYPAELPAPRLRDAAPVTTHLP